MRNFVFRQDLDELLLLLLLLTASPYCRQCSVHWADERSERFRLRLLS